MYSGIQPPSQAESTASMRESMDHHVVVQDVADHFAISGNVTSVRVVNKGQGQTKAWVEYATPQQALTAREHDQTVRIPIVQRLLHCLPSFRTARWTADLISA